MVLVTFFVIAVIFPIFLKIFNPQISVFREWQARQAEIRKYGSSYNQIQKVESWVSSQNLPKQQKVNIVLHFPEKELQVFKVSYGEAQDCLAGCFYSNKTGIKNMQKIGWIDNYELDGTDSFLFSREFYEVLLKAYGYTYRVAEFDYLFASDSNTPQSKLEELVSYVESGSSDLKKYLLANPSVTSNPALMDRLKAMTDQRIDEINRQKYVEQQRQIDLQPRTWK